MPVASQVSVRRPWKRTTASFGEVTTTIGGREDFVPGGASTITNGISYFSRKAIVRSTFFSLNHDAWRSSTAIGTSREALTGAHDLVARLAGGEEPARVLEEDGAQLAGRVERRDAVEEARPDLVLDLVRQVAGVDALLVQHLGGKRLAQVLRQPRDLRRLAGHQGVGLDVECEVGRGALEPQLARATGRQRVVGGVDLHDRELVRVVDEPILRGRRVGRVEDARRGHGRVGPGRGTDADRRRSHVERLAGGGGVRLGALVRDVRTGVVDG